MVMKKIPLFEINYTQDDIDAVERVIRRGSHWAKGQEVRDFENALAEYVGRKYCLCFNSGTSALWAACNALSLFGVAVAIPEFVFKAIPNVLHELACDPLYELRCETDTYGIDCSRGLDLHGKEYDAGDIVIMHCAGFPNRDTEKVAKYCDDDGEILIEDACEGLGATIHGKMVGTFGEVGVYSFCQNKIITTGEGGALVTDNIGIYEEAKDYRSLGGRYGLNLRMPSMNAALGLSQLQRIADIIKERRRQAHILNTKYPCALKEIKGHFQTYQMYLVKPDVEVPSHVETKMRFEGCELLKEIPLALSQEVAAQ